MELGCRGKVCGLKEYMVRVFENCLNCRIVELRELYYRGDFREMEEVAGRIREDQERLDGLYRTDEFKRRVRKAVEVARRFYQERDPGFSERMKELFKDLVTY